MRAVLVLLLACGLTDMDVVPSDSGYAASFIVTRMRCRSGEVRPPGNKRKRRLLEDKLVAPGNIRDSENTVTTLKCFGARAVSDHIHKRARS